MTAYSELHARIDRLSLRARLRLALAALAIPMLAAVLIGLALQIYSLTVQDDLLARDNAVATLVLKSRAALADVGGERAARRTALAAIRAHMRDVAALSAVPAITSAAHTISMLSYEYEQGAPPASAIASGAAAGGMGEMLERLGQRAAEAVAATDGRLRVVQLAALGIGLLAPLLALAGGLVLALAVTRRVDNTLRDCIAFAGDIADGNFRHGGAAARPGARARRMQPADDSASEFDLLVKSMNVIADETRTAAEHGAAQTAQLEQVDRAWRLLSACNQALVKSDGERALLDAICTRLVEIGGHRLAWVGYVRDDMERSIELIAHAGLDLDHIAGLELDCGPDVHRHGGCGTAIDQRRTLTCADLASDLVFSAWRVVPLPCGLRSCVALPLADGDTGFGMLCVCSSELNTFIGDELKMLQDLSEDLAFGILSRREASKRQRVEQALEQHVNYDTLTGLANRVTLAGRMAQATADAKAARKKTAAIYIDLDRFQDVNDTLGRSGGDRMLVEVGERLQSAAGEGATVARLGADEFVVLLPLIASAGEAEETAGRIVALLAAPLAEGPATLRPRASLGISLYPDDGQDADALLKYATLAMQDAKRQGGNTFRFYAPEMNARLAARFAMEEELSRALERGELAMHYQAQVSLVNGVITGAEALMRWRHPTRGMVAPAEFIRLAEETGLVLPIGAWAIDNVCDQLGAWRDAGLHVPMVAVNLSARQFQQKDLVQIVRQALERNRLPPKSLELEITESAVMRDVEAAIVTLRELKALGVCIALDDFGTGYSSLNYLKRFPIDHLKIDQSFVRDITTVPDDAAICNAVIGLAHNLHITVIAEGVETAEQMNYLRRHNCDEMQGYLFSRALPPAGYAQLLASNKKLPLAEAGEAQRTLLLLDDEPNIVRALNRALRADGYKILAATSAADALKLLALNQVQVVLSDQRMPEMSGTEFLSRVKDLYPETIRIILSGYTDLESVIDAINRGAIYRFFTKPWSDDMLRRCVGEAFRHHRLMYGSAEPAALETAETAAAAEPAEAAEPVGARPA